MVRSSIAMKGSKTGTQAYFDCNATTPVFPAAANAALEVMKTLYGNPSSTHLVGLQAKYILESTRKFAARVIEADPEEIIFTSGATEAIQTAVFSALQAIKHGANKSLRKLLYGATEHKVIPQALKHWVHSLDLPLEIVELSVNSSGQIDLEGLYNELPQAALLCTMAVNNETGTIQKLNEIESIVNKSGSSVLWLVDSVQALGKIPLSFKSTRINYASFSGHKLYAPKGIGFLYVRKGTPFTPLIVGGGQEKGLRSGTENLPGVAALGAVLEQLLAPMNRSAFHTHSKLVSFRDRIIEELKRAFPKIEFNTTFEEAVPTTINFSIPGLSSAELLDLFDSAGLRLSAGSACNSSSVKPSHVLDAMKLPLWKSTSALRLSFGPYTSEQEIEYGCNIIRQSAVALQNTCLLSTAKGFQAPENLRDGMVQFRAGPANSWLFVDRDSKLCIIIDPCDVVSDRIEYYVRCQNLNILAILDTHSHADHQSIRPLLKTLLREHFINHGAETSSLGWPLSESNSHIDVKLENNQWVPAIRFKTEEHGDLVLASLKTPGHTDDSVTFLLGLSHNQNLLKKDIRFAFPGDTILSGGLGRTNFSASNPNDLFYSLRALQSILDSNTMLCPAHDYNNSFATTLKTELEENSLLALALGPQTPLALSSFIQKKADIDFELARLDETFQGTVCGVTPSTIQSKIISITVDLEQFQRLSKRPREVAFIDIREPHEYSLFKDWASLGLEFPPRNVPLSRFVNFMEEVFRSTDIQTDVVLICRTGTRSLQAAKSLRRLGYNRVWSLKDGLVNTTHL